MNGRITIVYQTNPDGWVTASIPEFPGAVSQGRTQEQARAMVLDALNELMISAREATPHAPESAEESLDFEITVAKTA